jgi:hypothetical protein
VGRPSASTRIDRTAPTARPAPRTPARPPAAGGQRVDEPVDLDLCLDVDAAGGLVQQQDAALPQQPAGQHDLLLVAAGQLADQPVGVVGGRVQGAQVAGGLVPLGAPVDQAPAAEAAQAAADVAHQVPPGHRPCVLRPRGEADAAGWRDQVDRVGAPSRPMTWPASGRRRRLRAAQLGAAGSDQPYDPEDLARTHRTTPARPPGTGLNPQDHGPGRWAGSRAGACRPAPATMAMISRQGREATRRPRCGRRTVITSARSPPPPGGGRCRSRRRPRRSGAG